jgi:hypothetical protein
MKLGYINRTPDREKLVIKHSVGKPVKILYHLLD